MFEKRLKEISSKLGENKKKYFILTHKKHKREIYFRDIDKAINFMSHKFNSPKKRFIYILIKLRLLQLFLKKINLSSEFGEIIYIGNQIKGFNLEKKTVTSFPNTSTKKDFLKSKRFQKKVSSKGFSPRIIELNEEIPYSKEELLKEYRTDYISIFKRLSEFYSFIGIKKIPVKKCTSNLKKKTKDSELIRRLDVLSKKDFKIFITTIHGDLAKENILIKNGKIIFIDWCPYTGIITDDLVNLVKKGFSKNTFKSILEFYPKEVKENINNYLILSKISLKIKEELALFSS